MKQEIPLKHQFVEFIPEQLADSTLYVSMRFATVSHLCACGCGKKVVTPLKPADWKLIFDGKTVSLDPSIGNWSFPCRSHYWVTSNKVRWSEDWSQSRIDANRMRDRSEKEKDSGENGATMPSPRPLSEKRSEKTGWWREFWPWR
jgi:hypothetical protein